MFYHSCLKHSFNYVLVQNFFATKWDGEGHYDPNRVTKSHKSVSNNTIGQINWFIYIHDTVRVYL